MVRQRIHVYVSLQRLSGNYFLKMFRIQRISWFDSGYMFTSVYRGLSGDYCLKMFRIQRIAWFDSGYNVCVSLQRLSGDYFLILFRIQRISWFDTGYNICVSLRSFLGDDFVEMFVFSACGSTVDTRSLVYFTIFYVKVDTARAFRTGVWTYLSALYPAVPCSVSAVTVIAPVIHYCMGGLACGELCSFGSSFSGHPRFVRCGAVLGHGCSCPLLGTTGPHGPDSAGRY